MVKITQNLDECIGCGACTAVCDKWELNNDNKALMKGMKVKDNIGTIEVENAGCSKEAEEVCPVKCIKVE